MSLKRLQDALSDHLAQKKHLDSPYLQAHFAELILEPTFSDPKIPFELSDALRRCIMANDAINRVYETIDLILTLENTPDGIWKELRSFSAEYSDRSAPFRMSKVRDGTTLRACFRIISYLRVQGTLADTGNFLRQIEEEFRETGGKIGSHNEFSFLAADFYTDLMVYGGYVKELKEMLGVKESSYVITRIGDLSGQSPETPSAR